jgi:putative polyhydroxyalkanoate system protein
MISTVPEDVGYCAVRSMETVGRIMSEIVVKKSHNLGIDGAKEKVADFEEMMKKYGVKAKWSGNSAKLKGTGVSGSINVTDNDVTIALKLGMMAKAVGVDPVKLKSSIEKRLGPALAGE